MKSKLYTLLLGAVIILSFSCKTASKLYEKGKYDEAVELAAKKLQKDPNDSKLIGIVQDAYEYAANDHLSEIRALEASSSELRWEKLYYEYADLQKMYDAIYKVPSVYNLVKPADYTTSLSLYAERAGDTRIDRGMSFMEQGDKQGYKAAYYEFQAAIKFKPSDREATQRMNEAYEYAVTNVVVQPLQQYGGYTYSSYTIGGTNLDDRLVRDLQYSSGDEFVKFYSAWDARSQRIRVDQQVELRLSNFNIRPYQDYRSSRKVSKEIVVKETVYKPDSVVKEYAKVYADITTTRRTKASEALLEVTISDANGRWLWSDNFNATHNWSTEFASYTGDARALSDNDKLLINQREQFAPSEMEVSEYLVSQVNSDAQYRIRNFFNRY